MTYVIVKEIKILIRNLLILQDLSILQMIRDLKLNLKLIKNLALKL